METIDVPLAGAQFFICLIIVYLLVINTRIMSNMVDKDDPFTNGYLMAMLIFYIDMQRVFFKIFGMLYFINKKPAEGQDEAYVAYPQTLIDELTTTRYATMSMEMLFVIIPMRHNFIVHHVEI
jgi:hypothetical protein